MCNMDCFHCTKEDCTKETITTAERKSSNEYDTEIIGKRKYGRAAVQWRYEHSEKGKAVRKRYNSSDKAKATQERYLQSEKGKATKKRKQQQRIESGKNAEYCRAYYQRQKEKKLMEIIKRK